MPLCGTTSANSWPSKMEIFTKREGPESLPEMGSDVANQSQNNVSDRVMTVGIVVTVPNKFHLCVVLMFQTVKTMPTVITQSLTLGAKVKLRRDYFRHDPR